MTRAIRLTEKHARALISDDPHPLLDAALDEIRRQLAPRPKSSQVRKTERKRRTKRVQTQDVRAEVEIRANGICECGCGVLFGGSHWSHPELDHFRGRARAESVESCWLLRAGCHRDKTINRPSAAVWLERFIAHCRKHGYTAEAKRAENRLAFVNARGGR